MTKKILDRINKIQEAHPWVLEKEARHILVSGYAAFTNAYGLRNEELSEQMDLFTDQICMNNRRSLMDLLRETGGLS